MLVDHLRDRVPQQHDILVKRLDLTLEFDSVYQIDGNRDVLSTQCVEKRVLQKLAFIAHDILRV